MAFLALIVFYWCAHCIIEKNLYLNSFRLLELEQVCTINCNREISYPYWATKTTLESKIAFQEAYDIQLPEIDFEKEMFLVSYGSAIVQMDYNLREPTLKTKGKYVGFTQFDETVSDCIFVYRTSLIPIIDVELAGYTPDYNGEYRE